MQHDEFLSKYRATAVKHVVDTTRRVVVQKKNGTPFDVELRITEYKTAAERFFTGFVRDCSNDYAEVIARTLTHTLFDVTPMVAININGTVLNFNAAAEALVEFKKDLVIGKNVKF